MKTFPMFLKMSGRRVVICGGGEQAAQKARLMLKTEAAAGPRRPALEPELAALVAAGRARHHAGPVTATSCSAAPPSPSSPPAPPRPTRAWPPRPGPPAS